MKKPQKTIKRNKTLNLKIDQSGRIEYTSHDSVIAFSNSKKKAVIIKARDKRELQKRFREAGKSNVFVFRLFALLIFFLLKDEQFGEIVIDIEYPGRGDLIKNYLLHDFKRIGREVKAENIRFQPVGKSCEAHWHGYYVFKGKRKAEIKITVKEVLKEIFH